MSVKNFPLWANSDIRGELGSSNWLSDSGYVAGVGGNFWASQLCGKPVEGPMDTYAYLPGFGAGSGGTGNGHPGVVGNAWRIDFVPFLRNYVADIGSGFTCSKDIGFRGPDVKYSTLRSYGYDPTQIARNQNPRLGFYLKFHNDQEMWLGYVRFNINNGEAYVGWNLSVTVPDYANGRNWNEASYITPAPGSGEVILPVFRTKSGVDSVSLWTTTQGVWLYNVVVKYGSYGPYVESSSFDGGGGFINGTFYTVSGVSAGISSFQIKLTPDPGLNQITLRRLDGTTVTGYRLVTQAGVYQCNESTLFNRVFSIQW